MTMNPAFILGTPPPAVTPRTDIPSSFNWATVTDDSPLTIRLDGQVDNLGIVPDSLVDPALLTVAARVWVQQWGKRVLILGVASGGGGSSIAKYAHSSPSGFASTGYSTVQTFGDGSKQIVHNIEITRSGSTLGLASLTTWYYTPTAVIPSAARSGADGPGDYGIASYEDASEVCPVAVYINATDGTLAFKPITVTHTWDIGSYMWAQRTLFVPPP